MELKSRHSERDREHHHKSRKRKKRDSEKDESRKGKSKRFKEDSSKGLMVVDDDVDDDDLWVEKEVDYVADVIPTAESLKLTSHATQSSSASLPSERPAESKPKRDDWMLDPVTMPITLDNDTRPTKLSGQTGLESLTDGYGEEVTNSRTLGGDVDFFSTLGTERKRGKPPEPQMPEISSRELNPNLRVDSDGTLASIYTPAESSAKAKPVPGGPGSQWRMVRLRRTYEIAEEEGKSVEEIARDRYESLEEFQDAIEERRILDERDRQRNDRGRNKTRDDHSKEDTGPGIQKGEVRYMFNEAPRSGPPSRMGSFRRPPTGSTPETPGTSTKPLPIEGATPRMKTLDRLRSSTSTPQPGQNSSRTPIPSVFTPPSLAKTSRGGSIEQAQCELSISELNKLQAKALRAKLMGDSNADSLQKEYEEALEQASGGDEGSGSKVKHRVEVLPTLDGQGRLYDVGLGRVEDEDRGPGNRRKKPEKVKTRDPKTGEIVRYNADDDNTTLGELLRQEKFSAGSGDQKSFDAALARAIVTDGGFEDNLDYADDNADRLARKKMRSDAMKRAFAINDYKRTQKALATCPYCYGEDDSLPKAGIVAMGTRCYLAVTTNEELLDGHVCIVPIQHHLTTLEGDDDLWEEIKNFMKTLMQMFAEEDKGVVFYETVTNLKWQKHTIIECVPVPWEQFDNIPQYFKESLLASEAEWSTHRKVIDFRTRPGGFRRAMVPNLPYFMVMFDYSGTKGYGHVIEGGGGGGMGALGDEDGENGEDEGKGSEFPRWFAAEIIGNLMDVEPRRWRRPRRIDFGMNRERTRDFGRRYAKFDWTEMLNQ